MSNTSFVLDGKNKGFVSGFEILSLSQPYQTQLPSHTVAQEHPNTCCPAGPHPVPLPPGVSPCPCSAVLDDVLRSRNPVKPKRAPLRAITVGWREVGGCFAGESGKLDFKSPSASSFPAGAVSWLKNWPKEFLRCGQSLSCWVWAAGFTGPWVMQP